MNVKEEWLKHNINSFSIDEKNLFIVELNILLKYHSWAEIRNILKIGNTKEKELKLSLNYGLKRPKWGIKVTSASDRETSAVKFKNNFYKRLAKEAGKKFLNTFDIGNYYEIMCFAKAVRLGYAVFTPMGDGCSTDAIFMKNGKLFKVQIKSCVFNENTVGIKLTKNATYKSIKNGKEVRYKNNEVDVFITYVPHIKKYLWLPYEKIKGMYCITIRIVESVYKNAHAHDIKDFIWNRSSEVRADDS